MKLVSKFVFVVFFFVGLFVHPIVAQCPDGSAPPCGASRPSRAPEPNSIAVLFFDNLSRDSIYAYLADGLTEELISRLGHIRRLEVRSRHESRRVRGGGRLDPATLGRTLGAAYLLSGTVQTVGSRLRVTAELMRSSTGARVWGDVIDRSGSDLLGIQTEIATAVAAAVVGELLPTERAALAHQSTKDPAAYERYLRGRFLVGSYDRSQITLGMGLFREALSRDSSFALAYAGLAEAWQFLSDNWVAPREAMSQARDAAERAIAIDSTLAMPYVTLGMTAMQIEFAHVKAESLARRAIALDPRVSGAYGVLGHALLLQGRTREASVATARGWLLDSLSNTTAIEYLGDLYYAGRFAEALDVGARIRQRDPAAGRLAAGIEALVLLTQGECAAARSVITAIPPAERTQRAVGTLAVATACLGRKAHAEEMLASLESRSRDAYVRQTYVADLHAALGNKDEAFAALERAYQQRDWNVFHLLVPARVWWRETLRSDPRFQSLVTRMNLTEPEDSTAHH